MTTIPVEEKRTGRTIAMDVAFLYPNAQATGVLQQGDKSLTENQILRLANAIANWQLEHPQWVHNLKPLQVSVGGDPWLDPEENITFLVVPGQGGQRVRSFIVKNPSGEDRAVHVRLQSLSMAPIEWCRFDDGDLAAKYELHIKLALQAWWTKNPDYVADRDLIIQVSGNPWKVSLPGDIVLFFVVGEIRGRYDPYFEGAQGRGLQTDWLKMDLPWLMSQMDIGKGPLRFGGGPNAGQSRPESPGSSYRSRRQQQPSLLASLLGLDDSVDYQDAAKYAVGRLGQTECPSCGKQKTHCKLHYAILAEVANRASLAKDQEIATLKAENARLMVQVASTPTLEQIQREFEEHEEWMLQKITNIVGQLRDAIMASLRRGVKRDWRRSK